MISFLCNYCDPMKMKVSFFPSSVFLRGNICAVLISLGGVLSLEEDM